MRIEFGQWEWTWHLRLLPSIELSDYRDAGLEVHYNCRSEVTLRWLPYYLSIKFGGTGK
jgi:hypothetical protein